MEKEEYFIKRFQPDWELPAYAFLPGKHPHPNKEGGHMFGQEEPIAQPLKKNCSQENEILRYALDLFQAEYYWESHIYFEALWNAHNRKGAIADFLKGVIKLAAAGIKFKLGQHKAGIGHLQRGVDLFVLVEADKSFLGFDLNDLINQTKSEIERLNKSHSQDLKISVLPDWR